MKCSINDCNREHYGKTYCLAHYQRNRMGKSMDTPIQLVGNDSQRFWQKVDKSGDCWVWTSSQWGKGYGKFTVKDVSIAAHRFAYQDTKGPIPEGMQIDHLCMNKLCVNPDHLEAVTNSENQYRAKEKRGCWPIEARERKMVTCLVCNKDIEAIMYERKKYCSNACRCKAKRARRLN